MTILGDTTSEGTEQLSVKLTGATNATVDHTSDSAPLAIFDDDGSPRAAIGDLRVGEGAGHAQLSVVIAPPPTKAVTVPWSTTDGTAAAGTDYTATSGTLTFPAGTAQRTITVPLIDDGENGPNVQFQVVLGTVTGAGVQRRAATVTIANDNPAPSVFLDDAWFTEPAPPNNGTDRVPVRLSGPSRFDITLSLTAENGTAKAGSDYVGPPGRTSSFPPVRRPRPCR